MKVYLDIIAIIPTQTKNTSVGTIDSFMVTKLMILLATPLRVSGISYEETQ
jgi:hypothetical protein